MLQRLTQFWWLIVLRGIVSIVFAIVAFARPQLAFEALIFALEHVEEFNLANFLID